MAKKIDWSYHRPGCKTCGKTQEYLTASGVATKEEIDARKNRMGEKEALALLDGMTELYASKGKKVLHYNLKKDRPEDAELLKVMMGPTGNLRAPTLKIGKKLVIGFEDEMYDQVFG